MSVRALAASLLLGLATTLAPAAPTFTATDLGDLPGGQNWSDSRDINALGHVVGQSYTAQTAYHPFLWTPQGGMLDLGLPPGGFGVSYPNAVNNNDVVIGLAFPGTASAARYWRWQAGNYLLLPSGYAWFDINDAGQIAGYGTVAGATHAVVRQPDGTISDLGELSGRGNYSAARAINTAGAVAGLSDGTMDDMPFLWTPGGGMVALSSTLGGASTAVYDINDANQVVGVSGSKAFLATPGQGVQFLSTSNAQSMGINNDGWVVGCLVGACQAARGGGFFWRDPTEGMLALDTLIDPSDPLHGVLTVLSAEGINAAGQISITGRVNGVQHAYLLTPVASVPEPSVALLLTAGLLLAGGCRACRRR